MKYRVLNIEDDREFATESQAERAAQKLADAENISIWYTTDAGEAECVPSKLKESEESW